jgi:cytochrome c553
MKRNLLIATMFLAAASFAAAQTTGVMGTDVLGAHLNYGRGCAACHAPHSCSLGNGVTPYQGTDTGSVALWGEDASHLYGQTYSFGASKYSVTLPNGLNSAATGFTGNPSDVTGILMCLSCHDGNLAKGAMMQNRVYESLPSSYGTNPTIPTFIGNNGVSGPGAPSYLTDHPVGTVATFGCNSAANPESGYNWDCAGVTVSGSSVTVTPGPNMAKFIQNYGFFVSLTANGSTGYVTCTTCHNQHVMNVINVTSQTSTVSTSTAYGSGTTGLPTGQYATMFFLRGPYNPRNPSSNSAAQFCRQCHGGESNEMNGQLSVPTVD